MRTLAGICLLLLCTRAPAAELGRLFFSPEQRAAMDLEDARNARHRDHPNAISVNGIVQRKGGKRTVWINGVPQEEGSGAPDSAAVSVPGRSEPVRVKVGEKVLIPPGGIKE